MSKDDEIFDFIEDEPRPRKDVTTGWDENTPFRDTPLSFQIFIWVCVIVALFVVTGLLNKFAQWAF